MLLGAGVLSAYDARDLDSQDKLGGLLQMSIQSCTNHEYMGPVTAIFATSYTIGGGFAGSIPGAIWTQEMLGEIAAQMIELGAEPSLAMIAYATPYDFIVAYPGTT
ncbi:uncharacterized protein CXQ87_003615 [Candidozyma duobushaemuli]|uniref:Uncharacterized protein n=1 Tax=Candidozyma duobushaemuli TaxID=1231522 RepID=A0A2V1ADF8_9ASCO|nr:uncharacterized protein CXQ87_003615 [[Candida] duobushaemulonis]PVH15762.1 hypothetical protein CXQ87_003615 [[Candida] duobushaemulonis]